MSARSAPRPLEVLRTVAQLWTPDAFESVAPTTTLRGGDVHARAAVDLYLPERPTGDTLVLVHGGGFIVGSRRMKPMRLLSTRLRALGITVASVTYRKIPERLGRRGAPIAAALADVVAGASAVLDALPGYGLPSSRVTLAGLSAGGTLALLAADRLPWVAQVVGVFGLYDFGHLTGPFAGLLPPLTTGSRDPAEWRRWSPMTYAGPYQPTHLLHGTADALVPVAQAQRLHADREAIGRAGTLTLFEGAPHAFFNTPGPFAERGIDVLAERILTLSARLDAGRVG
ncbi:MAG: alpha/beta hydrolase [Myxococcales bacterium]|nr:alpha/beta hydrolase [Myxococcales bacterium]